MMNDVVRKSGQTNNGFCRSLEIVAHKTYHMRLVLTERLHSYNPVLCS